MRLEPVLRAHAHLRIEHPPEVWEPDTDESRFLLLLGDLITAAVAAGAPPGRLILNVSNVVVEPAEDGEEMVPPPAEYVAVTVRGAVDLGPDDTWRTAAPARAALLSRLRGRLEAAGARFAYVRRMPPDGSVTVFFARLAPAAAG